MMDFIVLVAAIYIGLVAASVTIGALMVAFMASGWYVKLCTKMTKKIMNETFDEFE